MKFNIRHFLFLLFCLNIFQSILTPIARDEAYYWMFGQNLDWGYFDHPPMVALMTYLGNLFFQGELGVRLITVFLSVGFAYIIWLLVPNEIRQKQHTVTIFSILFLANPLFNIYGFITTPDMPLLFFSAAYLYVFQRFNQDKKMSTALLLGFLMACLLYSKYHGILIILLSVASNISLFRRPLFYLASFVGFALYLPHLFWQWQHDFVSFEYHLFYRSSLFEWHNVFTYLLNFVLVFNPFIFPFFIIGLKNNESSPGRSRAMNFIFWGFFLFFLITSLRGHVEPHWVAVAAIPYTLYLIHFISINEKYIKSFRIVGYISLSVILCARLVVILPLPINSEFHVENEPYYNEILKLADGRNVLFADSYTHAAKFSFYTGQPSFSYNFISYRKNQYDLMDMQHEFHDKPAILVTFWPMPSFKKAHSEYGEDYEYLFYESLPLINNITVDVINYSPALKKGESNRIEMSIHNPYGIDLDFSKKNSTLSWELYYFNQEKERIKGVSIEKVKLKQLKAHASQTLTAYFRTDLNPGKYTFGIAIRPYKLFPISVSKRSYSIEVIDAEN